MRIRWDVGEGLFSPTRCPNVSKTCMACKVLYLLALLTFQNPKLISEIDRRQVHQRNKLKDPALKKTEADKART